MSVTTATVLGRALLLAVIFSVPSAAYAQAAAPSGSSASITIPEMPLPELPDVPSTKFERPKKEALEQLDDHLKRIRHRDATVRERAVREILEVRPEQVDAIYQRLDSMADASDASELKALLRKIRNEARNVVRERMKAAGEKGEVETPDYLEMVVTDASPKSEAWQALVSVLGMSRMLVAIGNVRAARALIHVYVRFGEFLRVDTQLQLAKLKERGVAALIEARRHPAAKIGNWAERQLDQLGKAIPSETVQTEDQQVLADVLRAYGRVRDPDAARIVISFANSERAQIRLAARQGVALMGEVANWQLRDTYENVVGERPRRDWSWKRTARELFRKFDQQRMAEVHKLFEAGLAAEKKRDLSGMQRAFDSVLAHNPMFDRRDEMVAGYFEFAAAQPADKVSDALLAIRRAERINQDEKLRPKLESLRYTLEGERELAAGIAEQVLFRRALELDPSNRRAREKLSTIERGEAKQKPETSRYHAALAIAAVALVAILLIAFWRPRDKPEPAAQPTTPDEPRKDEPTPLPATTSNSPEAPQPTDAQAAPAEGHEETALTSPSEEVLGDRTGAATDSADSNADPSPTEPSSAMTAEVSGGSDRNQSPPEPAENRGDGGAIVSGSDVADTQDARTSQPPSQATGANPERTPEKTEND